MIEFKGKFIDDASELLFDLEKNILSLENGFSNIQLIEEIFRALHTLKGTASMYGFDNISTLIHQSENIYQQIINDNIQVDSNIIKLSLQIVDYLILEITGKNNDHSNNTQQTLIENIIQITGFNTNPDLYQKNNEESALTGMRTWFITLKPDLNFEKRGIKLHSIFSELSEIGQITSIIRYTDINTKANPYWEIILASETPLDDINDILIFVQDIVIIDLLADSNLFEIDGFTNEINFLSEVNQTNYTELKETVKNLLKKTIQQSDAELFESKKLETVKVPSDKLDEQMLLLSELITAKAEIQLIIQNKGYRELINALERINKTINRLRKNIFNIRLLPLQSLQIRFDRLIRDLASQLNKKVQFVTKGMHIELDKSIIEQLEKPLMHLIRNCIDHGIEEPEIRILANKNIKGSVEFTAKRSSGNVILTISDDGNGINSEKIRIKAIEKGIITNESILTTKQLNEFIFTPGFSTAQNLTQISGRGIGMDIVKQAINNLRGTISIESEPGKGTKFIIKLPLTLSIIDTLLIKSGEEYYAIPASFISHCVEINKLEFENSANNQILINNTIYPYFKMWDNLISKKIVYSKNTSASVTTKFKAIIINRENFPIAIITNEILGEYQAVIKPLGDYFKNQTFLIGASQLSDGKLALIIDPDKLLI